MILIKIKGLKEKIIEVLIGLKALRMSLIKKFVEKYIVKNSGLP